MRTNARTQNIVFALDSGISFDEAAPAIRAHSCEGYDVHVLSHSDLSDEDVMRYERLTGNKPRYSVFDERTEDEITHITLAKQADKFIIFPSNSNTSDMLQAFVQGLAHTMPTAVYLANRAPIYIYEREICDTHALDVLKERDGAQIVPYSAS